MRMKPKIHELKIHPQEFHDLMTHTKEFEVRVNDREFQVDDILFLREFDPTTGVYSESATVRVVKYIMQGRFGLPEDLCVMGLCEPWKEG